MTKVSIFDYRFGGMDSYFPLHPELGVELGFRFSLQATSPRREKYYRTLVTTLWYCAHECGDESQSVATALPAPILEESATKDASRELLPHMFQKGEAGERSAGERHEGALRSRPRFRN